MTDQPVTGTPEPAEPTAQASPVRASANESPQIPDGTRTRAGTSVDRMPEPTPAAAIEPTPAERSADQAPARQTPTGAGFAWRQIMMVTGVLLIAAFVVERLRPEELTDRALAASPFLWSIVLWAAVILLNEFGFERNQMQHLQRLPLYVGAGAGAVVLVVGMVGLETENATSRFLYVLVNAVGASIFWWGLASLFALLARWVTSSRAG